MRVSKETAVLLKDAGYDVPCAARYDLEGELQEYEALLNHNEYVSHGHSAPTLHEAARWLREVKGWHVYCTTCNGRWQSYVIDMRTDEIEFVNGFPTHDLALSAGIDLILKKLNDGK